MAGTFTRIINGMQRTIQIDNEVAVSSGVSSAVVSFPKTLQTANASPRVSAWIFNSTDTNPEYFPVTITARSSTGFTASWNFPTPSANYILSYVAPDGWRP